MRLHAIILALNEEHFIANNLRVIYPFCTAISVLTQYDRDWYGKTVIPDRTVEIVSKFPDPEGKINLVLRRYPDEAAARNSEMLSFMTKPYSGTKSHGRPMQEIETFHGQPDYFWIIDADEIYDPLTLPAIIERLAQRRPKGMRIWGVNYLGTWNRPISSSTVPFFHFGFIRPGVFFEQRRTVSWNESRTAKLLRILRLPPVADRLWGFETCPQEIGVFHHGCWLGGKARLAEKVSKSSHQDSNTRDYLAKVNAIKTGWIDFRDIVPAIKDAIWPESFVER